MRREVAYFDGYHYIRNYRDIETGVVTGKFPRRVLNAVLDWYVLHQDELMANWEAAMNRKPLTKIEPLE